MAKNGKNKSRVQVQATASQVTDNGDNDDDNTEAQAVVVSNISAQSRNAQAVHAASTVLTNEVESELDDKAKKAEDVKKAAVSVMKALMASSEENDWELSEHPEPGREGTKGDNAPVEVWKEQVPKDGGGIKTVTYRYFHIMWDNSAAGKAHAKQMADLETDANLTASQKEAKGRMLKQRRNNKIGYLRRGFALWYRLERWMEKFGTRLEIEPVDESTPYPIHIYDAKDKKKNCALSVGEFFKINEENFEKDGGDWAALLKARARTKSGTTPKGDAVKLTKWQDVEKFLAAFNNFMDDGSLRASLIQAARNKEHQSVVEQIATANAVLIGAYAEIEDVHRKLMADAQAAITAQKKTA